MKSVFSDEYDVFLQELIAARKDAGFTQQNLACQLDKPQSFVSKYERRERRLDVVEFITIARALNVDPCRILRQVERQLDTKPKRGVTR